MLIVIAPGEREVGRHARSAVGLAVAAVVALVVSFGLFGMVWATNGSADRVAGAVGIGHLGGVLASLVAFVLAVRARLGRTTRAGAAREAWSALWLPLCLFPTLLGVWLLALVQGL